MKKILLFLILFGGILPLAAQPTVGLISNTGQSQDGYVLFAPLDSKDTYLIDKCGKLMHKWHSKHKPGQSVYLLPDGTLLRTANDSIVSFIGDGGKIEKLGWNSKVLWSCRMATETERRHHDIYPMPNGNILVILWDKKTLEDGLKHGRDPESMTNSLWSEKIIEIKPVGTQSYTIVWEWYAWDHLVQEFDKYAPDFGVVSENPQLLNLNYSQARIPDWLHFNSIDYNPKLDQILVSIRNFGEFFIIDHSTTTAQAASHSGGKSGKGGDLLYRWGNPRTYNRGGNEEQVLFNQHSPQWIPEGRPDAGKIIVFNNGLGRPGIEYSSVEIIDPPRDEKGNYLLEKDKPFGPVVPEWQYTDSIATNFFSRNISGAQRLSNGNTLICEGANGKFFEVNKNKKIVWKYINPITTTGPVAQGTEKIKQNHAFRCTLYEATYPGLKKYILKPGLPIELKPLIYDCQTAKPVLNKK